MKSINLITLIWLSVGQISGQSSPIKENTKIDILNGSHLSRYTNKWRMYSVDPNGKETLLRIWTDYMNPINIEGKEMYSRVQELYSPDMELRELWTNLFEVETLLPYRSSQFKMNGDYLYMEFNRNRVSTSTKTGVSDPIHLDFQLDQPVFDWTLYGILLSGLDFKKGNTIEIPIFNQRKPDEVGQLVATIVGQETIRDDNGNDHSTWLISTNVGLKFWLTKNSPYVIQLQSKGINGNYSVWRIFE